MAEAKALSVDGDDLRRSRRHPRPTQFDYLHLRRLLADLRGVLGQLDGPLDVLDVFCGTRPYEDLLPPGSSCVGLDINDDFGVADVVSTEFLPFQDDSFDLVICTEAFQYVRDLNHGVSEFHRVLRPGGTVLITVPLVWEYDRDTLEHRRTGPELAELFSRWNDVRVIENGGYAVTWATVTGRILKLIQERAPHRFGFQILIKPWFAVAYFVVSLAGTLLDAVERHYRSGSYRLPMNLMVTARTPDRD